MNMTYDTRAQIKYRNRKKEVRRNIALLVGSILLTMFAVMLLTSFSSQASDKSQQVTYKYYKSISLNAGDTLWSIAKTYAGSEVDMNAYIDEVKKVNSLKSNQIKKGSYLVVPYYSTEFIYE